MTTHASSTPTISRYLGEPLAVGEPDLAGPLAVYPIFGPEPRLDYISFAHGHRRGVAVRELESGASVNDLLVQNPTDNPVLLYEGEEVLGAQQNRTFDVTILVAAGAKLRVPVSCVEVGRWDFSRHGEDFAPAPQAAYPELRRAKSRQARERVAAGLQARADQHAVWDELHAKSVSHRVSSATGAMHDVYESHRATLRDFASAIRLHDCQSGALVAIAGRFTVFDYVSRPDVFEALHGPLVQGYALDGLKATETKPPSIDDARGFVALVTGTNATERDAIGLGRDLRFAADGVAGSALASEEELVQLTAFPEERASESGQGLRHPTRIRRPSQSRI